MSVGRTAARIASPSSLDRESEVEDCDGEEVLEDNSVVEETVLLMRVKL